jgi:hypothetical protein
MVSESEILVSITLGHAHYVRKAYSRRVRMKNGDTQIACLHRHVSYYRVIGDTRSSMSLISIHERRATLEHVTYLISDFPAGPLRY